MLLQEEAQHSETIVEESALVGSPRLYFWTGALASTGQVEDRASCHGKTQESRDPDGADQDPDRQIALFAERFRIGVPGFQRGFRLTQRRRCIFDFRYGARQRVSIDLREWG